MESEVSEYTLKVIYRDGKPDIYDFEGVIFSADDEDGEVLQALIEEVEGLREMHADIEQFRTYQAQEVKMKSDVQDHMNEVWKAEFNHYLGNSR